MIGQSLASPSEIAVRKDNVSHSEHPITFVAALRGLSGFSILLFHHWCFFWDNPSIIAVLTLDTASSFHPGCVSPFVSWMIAQTSTTGLCLLSIISGFVISLSAYRCSTSSFLIKRVFRVWPSYVVSLIFVAILLAIKAHCLHKCVPYSIGTFLANALLVNDFCNLSSIDGINWTLSIEVRFYILLACLMALFGRLSARVVQFTTIILVALSVMARFCLSHPQHSYPTLLTLSSILCVEVGFILLTFIGIAFSSLYMRLWSNSDFRWTVALLLGSACFCAVQASILFQWKEQYAFSYVSAFVVFAMTYLFARRNKLCKPLVWLGDISFPLFLLHGIPGYLIIGACYPLIKNPLLCSLIASSYALVAAHFFNIWIARPTQQWGRRLAAHPLFLHSPRLQGR
jgi:peptidoglycan/LPS O-acetylase OafA/YrhL